MSQGNQNWGSPVYVNQNVAVMTKNQGPGLFVRFLWFIFIGWWAGLWAIAIAYVFLLTILGIPIGLWILNRMASIMTLKPRTTTYVGTQTETAFVLEERYTDQMNFWIRAAYFLLVGWWFCALWVSVAYLMCLTIILMPVGIMMYDRVGAVTTLHQH